MLVYHNDKRTFMHDVFDGEIADIIRKALSDNKVTTGNAEYNAWNNSLRYMWGIIGNSTIPDDCEISIEYQIPLTSKRVDFIVTGMNEEGIDQVVIIELKQWDKCEKVDDIEHHTVRAFVGGNVRDLAHPSYQAYSYQVHIKNYSEVASEEDIRLVPLACLHNFQEEYRDVITDPIYEEWVKKAPVFLKRDGPRLSDFLSKIIKKKSRHGDLLYLIDNGKIRPAKSLQDCLGNLIKGNPEFMLMDEQATIYDRCRKIYADTQKDGEKRVMIIKGGPGTGKSVLAINLLNEFIRPQTDLGTEAGNVAYVTKNSAPRKCYLKILAKEDIDKGLEIKELFRSPFGLCEVNKDLYDCLLVDEAHRLVTRMNMDKGSNQIKEIIEAAKLSIFFIDESQRISVKDIGTVESITDWAKKLGVEEEHIYVGDNLVLSAQFRCNGSDGYINFLDNLLGIRETANKSLLLEGFEFKVFDDPCEMREALRKKNDKNKARMMAGYCYDWNVKNKRGDWDIVLPGGFKAKWNLPSNAYLWAINDDSFDEVGCIHTAQGLEFDHIGVIIGKDLIYRNGKVTTDRKAVSKDDKSSGIRTCKDEKLADRLIRNTYKVLLSRGQKSCYVYVEDKELREYIKKMTERNEA